MAGRIRRGLLSVAGGPKPNLVNMDWQENDTFDRTPGDDEAYGKAVAMNKSGSGSVELLAGTIPGGVQTQDWVLTYYEITMAAGVETKVSKTVTFKEVTCNRGGAVPSEGRGSRKFSFEFGEATEA